MAPKRIEICGGIAAGKTTLTQALGATGLTTTCEEFSAVPFWKDFYEDPVRFAFETELGFLLQHYNQLKRGISSSLWTVYDFSLIQDGAYAAINLNHRQRAAFDAVFDLAVWELGAPNLLIHLKCNETEQLRRIKGRARLEEAKIQLSYLEQLNASIQDFVAATTSMVFEISSDTSDFTETGQAKREIIREISNIVTSMS